MLKEGVRHRCAQLNALCVEYIASPEVLKAVVGTDGYTELTATCPMVLIEILEKVAAARRSARRLAIRGVQNQARGIDQRPE